MRVVATKFTFYKALISYEYLQSLASGFPPHDLSIEVLCFPPSNIMRQRKRDKTIQNKLGYDYLDPEDRKEIIALLIRMGKEMRKFV